MTDQVMTTELTAEELEQAFAEVEAIDPAIPTEVDGIPFEHAGDFDGAVELPEDNPAPPFNIDQELDGVNLEQQ